MRISNVRKGSTDMMHKVAITLCLAVCSGFESGGGTSHCFAFGLSWFLLQCGRRCFILHLVCAPYSVEWEDGLFLMNWEGFGRKRSRHYTGICMEGLGKSTKILSQNNRCPGRDSNDASPKCIILELCRSVRFCISLVQRNVLIATSQEQQ